eukprot:gene10969-17083_t
MRRKRLKIAQDILDADGNFILKLVRSWMVYMGFFKVAIEDGSFTATFPQSTLTHANALLKAITPTSCVVEGFGGGLHNLCVRCNVHLPDNFCSRRPAPVVEDTDAKNVKMVNAEEGIDAKKPKLNKKAKAQELKDAQVAKEAKEARDKPKLYCVPCMRNVSEGADVLLSNPELVLKCIESECQVTTPSCRTSGESSQEEGELDLFLRNLYKLGASKAADYIFKAVEERKLYVQFSADRVLGMDSVELKRIVLGMIERMLVACGVADLELPHGHVILDSSTEVSMWVQKMLKSTLIMLGGEGVGTGWHLDWESAFNILVRVLKKRIVDLYSFPTAMSTWATMGVNPDSWEQLKEVGGVLRDFPLPPADCNAVNVGRTLPPLSQADLNKYESHPDLIGLYEQFEGTIMGPAPGVPHAVLNTGKGISLKIVFDYMDWQRFDTVSLAHSVGLSGVTCVHNPVDYSENAAQVLVCLQAALAKQAWCSLL